MKASLVILCFFIFTLASHAAEILYQRHARPQDYASAWGDPAGSSTQSPSRALYTTTPRFRFSIQDKNDAKVVVKTDLLSTADSARLFGSLPAGDGHTRPIAAHGQLWLFMQNEDTWTLYSTPLDASKANWRRETAVATADIQGFALTSQTELEFFKKDGEKYTRMLGRFTGGGQSVMWEEKETVDPILVESLSRRETADDAAIDIYGEFDIQKPGTFLSFSIPENPNASIRARFAVSENANTPYESWSSFYSAQAINLDKKGRYLRYHVQVPNKEQFRLPEIAISYTFQLNRGNAQYVHGGGASAGNSGSDSSQNDTTFDNSASDDTSGSKTGDEKSSDEDGRGGNDKDNNQDVDQPDRNSSSQGGQASQSNSSSSQSPNNQEQSSSSQEDGSPDNS
ncbi:hypothetical protein GF373_04050, partial [bacterium]|nr:hypothetical protein [bacterium]